MDSSRKELEMRLASPLVENLGLGGLEQVKSEAPDIVISDSRIRIGIEVTEVTRTFDEMGRESNRTEREQNRLVAKANELFEQKCKLPVWVSVFFSGAPVLKADSPQIAEWLSTLVFQNLPEIGSSFHWDSRFTDPKESYPTSVSAVSVNRPNGMFRSNWHVPRGAWPESGIGEAFDSIINKKQGKLQSYLQHCDQCYLLLVADWNTSASAFDPPSNIGYIGPKNGFTGVYCLLRFHGLVRLECRG